MPRYRNSVTGVIVGLPDDHAVALGSDWAEVGADKPAPAPAPKARNRRAKPASDE